MYSLTEMSIVNAENFVKNYGQYFDYYRWLYGLYGIQTFVTPLAATLTTVGSYQTEVTEKVQVNNHLGTFESQAVSPNPAQEAETAHLKDQVDAATIAAANKKVQEWILSSDFNQPVEEAANAKTYLDKQVCWPKKFSQERDLLPTPVSSAASVKVEKVVDNNQVGWNYFCWRCLKQYDQKAVDKLVCKPCATILNFQCQRCTRVFPLYSNILSHKCHPVSETGSCNQVEDGYLRCEYCHFKSKSEWGIKSHSTKMHRNKVFNYLWIRDFALDLRIATLNSAGRSKADETGSTPGLTVADPEYGPERGNSFQLYCVGDKDQPKRYQRKYSPYGSFSGANCFISKAAQNFYQTCN